MKALSLTKRIRTNEMNRHVILNLIKRHGPIYRAEIARLSQIRPGTVLKFVNDLLRKGLIKELGLGKSSGGRKPVLLKINPQSKFAIGVYLSGVKIKSAIVDLNGEIRHKMEREGKADKGKAFLLKKIIEVIEDLISRSKLPKNKFLGIGLGVPGFVDTEKGIALFSTYRSWWRDIRFKETIENRFRLTVEVDNDTRLLTMAEKWFGQGRGLDNFLYIDVGGGIGVGIVINGKLYRGTSNRSGEFGHMSIEKNGPQCRCGNKGCLEKIISTSAMTKKMAKDLGIGIINLINLFDPKLVIIGGQFSKIEDDLLEEMREVIKERVLPGAREGVELRRSELPETAGAQGASTLVLSKLFDAP